MVVIWRPSLDNRWKSVFLETSRGNISWGRATIYYYPTTVAWDDVISINIPWLETRIIDLSILPSSWVNTQIMIENDELNLWDSIDVEIFLSDKWWNLVDGSNVVNLSYDDENLEI